MKKLEAVCQEPPNSKNSSNLFKKKDKIRKTDRKTSQRRSNQDGLEFILVRFERLSKKSVSEKTHLVLKTKSRERMCLRSKAYAKVASAAFQAKEFSKAHQLLTRAINYMPTAALFAKRSVVHLKLENYQLAASDGTWAIGLDRTSPSGFFCRALALIHLREYELALRDLGRLRHCLPNSKRCNHLYVICRNQFWKRGEIEPFEAPENIIDVPVNEEFSVFVAHRIHELKLELSSSGVIDATKLTEEFVIQVIETYKQGIFHLPLKHIFMVLHHVLDLLKERENIVHIDITQHQSLTVVGDIRGNFHNLMSIFNQNRSPQFGRPYLFNGNIIGGYKMSLPCIVIILCMKILFPDDVYINRGSEECLEMCETNGFENEVLTVYDEEVMKGFTEVFNWLPLAHVLNNSVLIIHGGLFERKDTTLKDVQRLKRWFQPPDRGSMCDILHSDPWNNGGVSKRGRQKGVWFGPDVAYRFCMANCLDFIVRSHQMPNLMGYGSQPCRYCITINSSSQHATYLKIPGTTDNYHVHQGRKEMKIPKNCSCWIMCNCCEKKENEEDSLNDYATLKLDLLPIPSEPIIKSLTIPSSSRSLIKSRSSRLKKADSSASQGERSKGSKKNRSYESSKSILYTGIERELSKSTSSHLVRGAHSSKSTTSSKQSEHSTIYTRSNRSPPIPTNSDQLLTPEEQRTTQPPTIGDEVAPMTTQSDTLDEPKIYNMEDFEQTKNETLKKHFVNTSSDEEQVVQPKGSALVLVRSMTRSAHWLAVDHELSPIHSVWSPEHEFEGEHFAVEE